MRKFRKTLHIKDACVGKVCYLEFDTDGEMPFFRLRSLKEGDLKMNGAAAKEIADFITDNLAAIYLDEPSFTFGYTEGL